MSKAAKVIKPFGEALGPVIGVLSAVTGIATAINEYKEQEEAEDDAREAKKKAQKLANENAANIIAESEEEARRAEMEKEEQAGALRARLLQSGGKGVSANAYIQAFLKEKNRQIEWIRTSGQSRAKAAKQQVTGTALPGGSKTQLGSAFVATGAKTFEWFDKYVE